MDKIISRSNFSKLFVFVSHRLGSSLQRNHSKLKKRCSFNRIFANKKDWRNHEKSTKTDCVLAVTILLPLVSFLAVVFKIILFWVQHYFCLRFTKLIQRCFVCFWNVRFLFVHEFVRARWILLGKLYWLPKTWQTLPVRTFFKIFDYFSRQ